MHTESQSYGTIDKHAAYSKHFTKQKKKKRKRKMIFVFKITSRLWMVQQIFSKVIVDACASPTIAARRLLLLILCQTIQLTKYIIAYHTAINAETCTTVGIETVKHLNIPMNWKCVLIAMVMRNFSSVTAAAMRSNRITKWLSLVQIHVWIYIYTPKTHNDII